MIEKGFRGQCYETLRISKLVKKLQFCC